MAVINTPLRRIGKQIIGEFESSISIERETFSFPDSKKRDYLYITNRTTGDLVVNVNEKTEQLVRAFEVFSYKGEYDSFDIRSKVGYGSFQARFIWQDIDDEDNSKLDEMHDNVNDVTSTVISSFGTTFTETFGLNVHDSGYRDRYVDYDLIKEYGFTVLRSALVWHQIERTKGVYEFQSEIFDCDKWINNMVSRGFKPHITLLFANNLYSPNWAIDTPEAQQAYANFAKAAATRYAGQGITWELYNEPNGVWFWNPQTDSAKNYVKAARLATAAIKEADPTATVVGPALYGPEHMVNAPYPSEDDTLVWLEQAFQEGLLDFIDGLTLHPYRDLAPETVSSSYAKTRTIINKYTDRNIPIICGEWGYANPINWDGQDGSGIVPDELTHAQYVTREFLINHLEDMKYTIYYDWKNDGERPEKSEDNFGLVNYDQKTPKKAGTASKVLGQVLYGYSLVKRIDIGNNNDYVLHYTNNKKGSVYVYWTTDTEHSFYLHGSYSGHIVTMLGDEYIAEGKDLKLTISGSPNYLVVDDRKQTSLASPIELERKIVQTKKDVRDMFVSYGIGKIKKNLDSIDLNTVTRNEINRITNLSINKPSDNFWGSLFSAGFDASKEGSQFAINSYDNKAYWRVCQTPTGQNPNWLPWKQVASMDDVNTVSGTISNLTTRIGTLETNATSHYAITTLTLAMATGVTKAAGENVNGTQDAHKMVDLQGGVSIAQSANTTGEVKLYTLPAGSWPLRTIFMPGSEGKFKILTNGEVWAIQLTPNTAYNYFTTKVTFRAA